MSGKSLDGLVQEIRDVDLNIDDMGEPSDFIGVNLSREDGVFHFAQRAPILIAWRISDFGLSKPRRTIVENRAGAGGTCGDSLFVCDSQTT